MDTIRVYLLDKDGEPQYGLNWGQRIGREPNQAYLQLESAVYNSDFFPVKGTYFLVYTDDKETFVMNRAQKTDTGTAIQTPENNSILGLYLRKRFGVSEGEEITKADILNYGRIEISFKKVDDRHYSLDYSKNWKSIDIPHLFKTYLLTEKRELTYNVIERYVKEVERGNVADIQSIYNEFKDSYFFHKHYSANSVTTTQTDKVNLYRPYITAIKSKPFLLLAGISGTGKSRIVRELAFKSCPEYLQDKDGTTPGNYCMIEVKPNWHDSTELLGYYSNMNKSYQFKKFVKFLVKAKMFPKVPFFVCLDEMNLAPVEHYFAEILSIMETRKHPKKENSDEVNMGVIRTGVIVESQYFKGAFWKDKDGINHQKIDMSDKDWYEYFYDVSTLSEGEKAQIQKYQYSRTLQTEGLTLPDNVIIIGTVNMDDTTHQFSRKVIDRAMTIEMNGGKLSNMFGGSKDLEYLPKDEQEKWQECFRQRYVNADEVLDAHPDEKDEIIKQVPAKLENINKALKGTPFEVSYRVLNELTIMVGVLLDNKEEGENIDDIINQALDHILLMKILPRIEGDSDMFNLSRDFKQENHVEYNNRLEWLMDLAPEITIDEQEGDDHRQTAREKIKEMIDRLENQEFTRFWP